jgi:antitoxin ParD1/3/4
MAEIEREGDGDTARAVRLREFAALKSDIARGLADLAEGRVYDFDVDRIIERGRRLLADR